MPHRAAILALSFVMLASGPVQASTVPVNGTLRVAYRQSEDGKLSESVHHVTLSCWDGQCSLTTLTLNQCFTGGSVTLGAFYPKIERSSTGERGFSVIELRPGLILVEHRDEATMTYQFQYTTREDPNLSSRLGLKQTRWFERLTGFSGGALKYSVVLGKVLTWDFVPLKGTFPRIKAACDIMLDGVPE